MKIHGLQKLTLIDYPGKVAATLFFAGCGFRCPFCHNASLVTQIDPAAGRPAQEVLDFLAARKGLLDGVCISGGEPLLRPEIEPFIKEIKAMGYSVKLDTNGQQFSQLVRLADQGLIDYVAMDIKNALPKYGKTIGLPGFDTQMVEKSAQWLLDGPLPYEFRTTVVRELHEEQDFHQIGRWLRGAKRYYLQSFIDSGDTITKGLSAYTKEELEHLRQVLADYIPCAALREVE